MAFLSACTHEEAVLKSPNPLSLILTFCDLYSGQVQGEARGSAATGTGSAVKYRGVFGTITTIVRIEGPRSLYSGLVAGLQRQMSFASVRIGLYDSVKQFYTKGSDCEYLRLYSNCWSGSRAGIGLDVSFLSRFRRWYQHPAACRRYHWCHGGCFCSAYRCGESPLPGRGQVSWASQTLLWHHCSLQDHC